MIAALTRMAYIPGDAIAGLADGDRPGTGTDVKCAVAAGRFAGRAKEAADWREAIYQQAFEIAGTAQDPLPGISAKSRTLDLQTGIKCYASRMLGLDTLSLRVRAIQGLQEFRLTHAIELIQLLDTRVAALTCRDELVPNPTAMFDVGRLLPVVIRLANPRC
jgi:hypothetical protein